MYNLLRLFSVLFLIQQIFGHGMLLDPPNRSSLWRYYRSAPINYNDNQNFCGGFQTQWFEFGGKCGPCGDKYDDPHPQDNENTGKFGRGLVSAQYTAGSVINVTVLLTANHMGEFTYSLCVLRNESLPETDDDCFQSLRFADGANAYAVSSTDYNILNKIQLPPNLTCDRCVLRWHYTAGNNWGVCTNGTSGMGCGPQETFRSCSDIRIL